MKNLFFTAAFIITLTAGFLSCNNEDSPIESPTNIEQPSNKRSFNEALVIAQNATNMLGDKQSRSSHRTINRDDAFAICSGSAQSRNSDTLLYIFNYDDNAGYAIVSASLNTEGLLAVAESGRLDSKEHSEVPGVNMFIDLAKSYVALSDTGKITVGGKIGGDISTPTMQKEENETIYSCVIEPRLKINWGQTGCEGELFSNKTAGCATIAILNVLTYLEQPTSIQLTKSDNSIMINWHSIKSLFLNPRNGSPYHTTYSYSTISKLCKEIAFRCKPTLDDDGTSINLDDMYIVTKGLVTAPISNLYSNYHNSIRGNLSGIEVIYGRHKDSNNKMIGHFWIVDGTQYYEYIHKRYIKPDNRLDWILTDEFNHTVDLQHINWGWYGIGNGYYNTGVFNTTCCQHLDYKDAAPSDNYNYNYNLHYFNVFK